MRIFTLLLVAGLLASLAARSLAQLPSTNPGVPAQVSTIDAGASAVVIVVDGEINDYRVTTTEKRFEEARKAGARVIILQLRTYGGAVTSALNMSRFIKRQDDLHIICLVDDYAYSAGSMIALACDEIFMEPGAIFGDSGVISMGGTIEGETERAKAESPVVEEFRDSARKNGYSELLAGAFVQVARQVYVIENITTGEKNFVNEKDYAELTKSADANNPPQWRDVPGVRAPLDDETTLLTLSAEISEKIGLSKGTIDSPEKLAGLRNYTIVATLSPHVGDQLIDLLSSSLVRGVLSAGLLLSIYAFLRMPGTGIPETIGVVALGVLLGVPFLTGYAQWYEIILVVLGLVLLALEIFLIPGFGFFGISGIVMLLGGLTMTFLPPLVVPGLPGMPSASGFNPNELRNALVAMTSALVGSIVIWGVMGRFLPSVPYFNRLILTTTVGSTPEPIDAASINGTRGQGTRLGSQLGLQMGPQLGQTGEVVTDLRPGGTAMFSEQTTGGFSTADVVSDRGFVSKGQAVVVTEIHGNRVVVRPTPQGSIN